MYKTRNEFKNFDEFGNEVIIDEHVILENPVSSMNATMQYQSNMMVDERTELLI